MLHHYPRQLMQIVIIFLFPACEEGPGICSLLLTIGSLLLIIVSLPVSLLVVIKVVQVFLLWWWFYWFFYLFPLMSLCLLPTKLSRFSFNDGVDHFGLSPFSISKLSQADSTYDGDGDDSFYWSLFPLIYLPSCCHQSFPGFYCGGGVMVKMIVASNDDWVPTCLPCHFLAFTCSFF